MGAGGVPNRTIEIIDGKRGDLPTRGAKQILGMIYMLTVRKYKVDGLIKTEWLLEIEIMVIRMLITIMNFLMTITGAGITDIRRESLKI